MTDWKDVPHLFANGNFKVGFNQEGGLRIELFNASILQHFYDYPEALKDKDIHLIARPIESMSDEEVIQARHEVGGNTIATESIIDTIMDDGKGVEHFTYLFLYLLSIGVYPFSQSHFGDSVINANEIEEV